MGKVSRVTAPNVAWYVTPIKGIRFSTSQYQLGYLQN